MISRCDYLITDGWAGYDWADDPNSGFIQLIHIYGRGYFGKGQESTSYFESI